MTGKHYFQRSQLGNWFGDCKRTSCGVSFWVRSDIEPMHYASNDDYPLHDPHLAKCYEFIRESMIRLSDIKDVHSLTEHEVQRLNLVRGLYDLLDECDGKHGMLISVSEKLPLREATFLKGLQSIDAFG